MAYTVYSARNFEKIFEKRHGERRAWLNSMKNILEQNPKLGKPLGGRLHKIWQLRIGPFRVWYKIDDKAQKVELLTVLHKDEAQHFY
ncbi:MAG: type II toxin-antitoxin system RelE/ParE family toxin [Candidatus Micrarchaeota archaeon]|nr:type II toxin-antitoxin system RelE/ParE family toxin [Candidatus Micrarchaeota archaeon]